MWAEETATNAIKLTYAKEISKLKFRAETKNILVNKALYGNETISTQPRSIRDPSIVTPVTSSDNLLESNGNEPNETATEFVDTMIGSELGTVSSESQSTVSRILAKAYKQSKPNKHFLVLINPNGGPGKAQQIYETSCAPLLKMARCKTTVIVTTHRFHAQELARDTEDIMKYDAVICCSGDGIPHEFINGLAQRKGGDAREALSKLALCQLPCGSGNSVANSIYGNSSPTYASLGMIKGTPIAMDLMLLTQDDNKCLSFLSQAIGTIADADLGTEHLRWMGGTRFVYGTLKYTLQGKSYPCDIYVKYTHETTEEIKQHYIESLQTHHDNLKAGSSASIKQMKNGFEDLLVPRFGSINDPVPSDWTRVPNCDNLSLMYCGKMPWVSSDCMMFPATLPTDGTMDIFITNTKQMSRPQAIKMLTGMETGTHIEHDFIQYSKAEAYRLVPKHQEGNFSVDGEKFPYHPFQVEILPSVGCFLSFGGMWTKTGFANQ